MTTRHLNINNQDYTTSYTYNDGDKVAAIVYPNSGPTVNYVYFTGGTIKQVTRSADNYPYYDVSAANYDQFGHVTQFKYGNGVVTTRGYYSASDRLQSISSSVFRQFAYTASDDISSLSGSGISGTTSVTYDPLHRISTYSGSSGLSGSYSYDAVGSILQNIEGGGSTYTYGNSRKQAVKTAFGYNYLYDLCGNMIVRHGATSGSQALGYDPENRLTTFSQAGNIVVEYGYADDGTRLWKRINQDPAQVQLWIGKIYEEKNDASGVHRTLFHVFAGDQQVCTFEAGSALAVPSGNGSLIGYYYHEDNLNSSSALSSSGGSPQEVDVYYPFGRTEAGTLQTSFQVSRRFTGQILDAETGLYYYNARYYDPELGRFIQPDTVIQDLSNPQSFNRYSYCVNNPLRYTDPTGLDYWGDVGGMFIGYYQAGAGLVRAWERRLRIPSIPLWVLALRSRIRLIPAARL